MDQLACVSVPSLALQIAIKRYPELRDIPAVVVDVHKPQGFVLEVNRAARKARILPGMRYAAALSLNGSVRAVVIPNEDRLAAVEEMIEILRDYSPRFEVADDQPGTFWLDIRGLDRLFGSLDLWSLALHEAMSEMGFLSAVVVGFTRFGTYAFAQALRARVHVFARPADETQTVHRLPIDRIGLDPKTLGSFKKLGIETVGQFSELPAGGVRERFSAQASILHRMSRGELVWPLRPVQIEDAAERRVELDEAESDSNRLLFIIKRELHPLLLELSARHEDLKTLHLSFHLADHDTHTHTISPARPTLEDTRILELVRLKLERMLIPTGVCALSIRAEGVPIRREQSRLFKRSSRDLEAASHALARLRTEFGEGCVLQVVDTHGHLPEERFSLEPRVQVPLPDSKTTGRTAIRRIRFKPEPLHRFRNEPLKGWLVRGLDAGPIVESWGPYVLSTGWWGDHEAHREYHFAQTRRGDLVWLYWDGCRHQWFLHGDVE